jgi:hypothetical protein
MANKVKTLTVTLTESKEQTETNFQTKGLTDFEIIGILSYYLDAYKVKMLRDTEKIRTEERGEDGSKA